MVISLLHFALSLFTLGTIELKVRLKLAGAKTVKFIYIWAIHQTDIILDTLRSAGAEATN
jgi:hypothetical protein